MTSAPSALRIGTGRHCSVCARADTRPRAARAARGAGCRRPKARPILPQPRALPPLALVDQDGAPLPRDFLRDRWTIVFFGFTQCPDICPTTLATLAQMKQKLADLPAAQQPRVLLVSVDPERDTPAMLKPPT